MQTDENGHPVLLNVHAKRSGIKSWPFCVSCLTHSTIGGRVVGVGLVQPSKTEINMKPYSLNLCHLLATVPSYGIRTSTIEGKFFVVGNMLTGMSGNLEDRRGGMADRSHRTDTTAPKCDDILTKVSQQLLSMLLLDSLLVQG